MPLRATETEEAIGMDIVQHGEEAYARGEGAILRRAVATESTARVRIDGRIARAVDCDELEHVQTTFAKRAARAGLVRWSSSASGPRGLTELDGQRGRLVRHALADRELPAGSQAK